MQFAEERAQTWDKFLTIITKLSKKEKDTWVYRGHGKDYPLATSLERAQKCFSIAGSDLPGIEEQMIRYYRRGFPGERENELNEDKLYCISLMQHHGAPTRLIDFTWSPYIGLFFALDDFKISPNNADEKPEENMPVLWCINRKWIESMVDDKFKNDKKKPHKNRWWDKKRDDGSFENMYMRKQRKKFVGLENPIRLNTRLVIQQGIFLCPGDVSCPFEENLKSFKGWNKKDNVFKIYFNFSTTDRAAALETLRRMNITQASLFPGLDGYSRSMKQLVPLFKRMSVANAGEGGIYNKGKWHLTID